MRTSDVLVLLGLFIACPVSARADADPMLPYQATTVSSVWSEATHTRSPAMAAGGGLLIGLGVATVPAIVGGAMVRGTF